MVRTGKPLKKMSTAKRRSTALFVIALACLLWTEYARAQDTPSDLVTRIDRLEETVRDLTGSVQELQYRNQQLEQQVQQLRGGAAPVAGTVPAATTASDGFALRCRRRRQHRIRSRARNILHRPRNICRRLRPPNTRPRHLMGRRRRQWLRPHRR